MCDGCTFAGASKHLSRTSMPGRIQELCQLYATESDHQVQMHRAFEALVSDKIMAQIKERFVWVLEDSLENLQRPFG